MKSLQAIIVFLSIASVSFAYPKAPKQTSKQPAPVSTTQGGITQTRVCQAEIKDGSGNGSLGPCTEGTAGCNCINRFTEIRCNRVLEDGTGNATIEDCDKSEEGVNGCGCGETLATEKVEACNRIREDGTGNGFIESCDKSEEGVDGCNCGLSTKLVDSLKF